MHCSGVAPSEINDYSALEWSQTSNRRGSTADGNTNCMFVLTSISIWVTSILYFGSRYTLGKRFVCIRSGWMEQLPKPLSYCYMSAKVGFYGFSWSRLSFFQVAAHCFTAFLSFSRSLGYFSLCSFKIIMKKKARKHRRWPSLLHRLWLPRPLNICKASCAPLTIHQYVYIQGLLLSHWYGLIKRSKNLNVF